LVPAVLTTTNGVRSRQEEAAVSGGFEYTEDEFENFARSSEARKAEFAALHSTLEGETRLPGGAPFGRMPWSGALESAYTQTRTALLDMTDSAALVMQTIADNIRTTRDNYTGAEVGNVAEIEKIGEDA